MWVIGDIHGCVKTLKELYSKLDGEIYSVGDLVDKGPDSSGVLDFVIKKKIKCVLGNHDIFFIEHGKKFLNGEDIINTVWYSKFGGNRTINSYDSLDKMEEHIKFLSTLPIYYKVNDILITHGFGLPYKNDLKNIKALTCNRLKRYQGNINELDGFNVFGHDAFKEVCKHKKYIGIDTGCVYGKTDKFGGKLTAYNLITKEIISVDLIDDANYSEDELC